MYSIFISDIHQALYVINCLKSDYIKMLSNKEINKRFIQKKIYGNRRIYR